MLYVIVFILMYFVLVFNKAEKIKSVFISFFSSVIIVTILGLGVAVLFPRELSSSEIPEYCKDNSYYLVYDDKENEFTAFLEKSDIETPKVVADKGATVIVSDDEPSLELKAKQKISLKDTKLFNFKKNIWTGIDYGYNRKNTTLFYKKMNFQLKEVGVRVNKVDSKNIKFK
jgi:hypothetical protein